MFDKTNGWGATGTSHAYGIVIQVNGMSAASDVANQVRLAILHANGHAGTITAVLTESTPGVTNVVSLTQVTPGVAGNVTIAPGSLPTPSYILFAGMSGSGGSSSSNPYQGANHKPLIGKTNTLDKSIKFLIRPARALDNQHFSLFRHAPSVKAGAPQVGNDYYRSTSGGKYGVFSYDIPNARGFSVSPTAPPYKPVYRIEPTVSSTVPTSQGPVIPGADVTGFDKTSIKQTTGRMVMSENTLEHFRSDAPRRRVEKETGKEDRADYSIQPRFSQNLHPKGEDATTDFNTGDHSGE